MTRIHVGYAEQDDDPLNNPIFFETYKILGCFHSYRGALGFFHVDIPNTKQDKEKLRKFVESQIEGKVTKIDEWEQ